MPSFCAKPGCTLSGTIQCFCGDCYCSYTCQAEHVLVHRSAVECPRESVKAVQLNATKTNESSYEDSIIKYNDSIFENAPVPISVKLGYPLVVRKLDNYQAGTTNTHATWLHMNPKTARAPTKWQNNVGDVIVARADRTPLALPALYAFTDYLWDIIETQEPTDAAKIELQEFYQGERLMALHEKLDRAVVKKRIPYTLYE